jgi:2-polyprenyl-3-methyl-5-hydroxy-6-metoxy-1,4-benzoquinol methylase
MNFPPLFSRDVIWIYRKNYGVDVSRFFTQDRIELLPKAPHGYFQFEPSLPGDSQFYNELMDKRGYSPEKAEFRQAAEWIAETDSVLDVGSGPGQFSVHCKGQYKGVDTNPGAVAEAKRHGRNVAQEQLEDQPAETFDVVAAFQVLEHVPDPEQFFAELARCVAPGGKLIVSTPDLEGPMGHAVNTDLNYPPHHLTWWSAASLQSLFRANGFVPEVAWKEPIQRGHFWLLIYSFIHPLGTRHVDRSIRSTVLRVFSKVVGKMVPRSIKEIPYATGHTVMVMGTKR